MTVTRIITQQDVGIDVGVQKRLGVGDADEFDPLMALAEKLQAFSTVRVSGFANNTETASLQFSSY